MTQRPAHEASSPTVDTVESAHTSPDREQPWAELGLKPDEYANVREILGRRPTSSELAMYSVMWSEHCSYKSSKVHLRQFGEKVTDEMRRHLMVGIGENAGVVDIGDGYAVTFKVESHNHPSYVEPYQGAATGVGGIVRDILAMGARPVAVMDPLRFGPLDHPDTHRLLPGIVAGVGGYGNCLGLPNIGGEAVFDETYAGNPLVNALCVGVMRHEQLHLAKASGAGNLVVLYGARTGGDGIGGVSVLASETFESTGPAKRPSVQVGDPFQEKLLVECTLELFAEELVVGIQDLGGAGLSCATSELASAGDGGMHVWLDRVPLRDSSLAPEEILMSESQERMMAVVEPADEKRFLEICEKWDVEATVIGEVDDSTRLTIEWHGETVVDVPPRSVAHDGPTYQRPFERPSWQDDLQADTGDELVRPSTGEELRQTLLRLVASPNLCDKSWITDQYDRYVQGNTVLAQPEDSGMVRVDPLTGLGVAVATDCNGRFAKLDPYAGAQLALAEAHRNVATVGRDAAGRQRLPQLRVPRGPGRDVAVRRGDARAGRRLPGARRAGDRRQRQPLQPDRRDRDPADARWWRCSASSTTSPAAPRPGSPRRGSASTCWVRRATSCPARSGRTSCTATSVACRPQSTSPRRSGSPTCSSPHHTTDWSPARTTSPTAASPRRWWSPACSAPAGQGVGARVSLPATRRSSRCSASRPAERSSRSSPTRTARFAELCETHGVPQVQIGVTEGTGADAVLDVQGQFAIALADLRAAWTATLPDAFA